METSEARPSVGVIVIGGSAGGMKALTALIARLPADYPIPLLVVLHIPPNRASLLTEVFRARTALPVAEASDKVQLTPGLWFAPPNYHLVVESEGVLALSTDPLVLYARPAIDVLFQSAADVYGPRLLGIILSGASSDGARGLEAVVEQGGTGWVQDPETSHSVVMPRAALTQATSARALSVEEMAERLRALPEE